MTDGQAFQARGDGFTSTPNLGFAPPPFRSRAPWLGPDLQTLRNLFTYERPDFSDFQETRFEVEMPDGSGDKLHAVMHRAARSTKPPIVLIHGLTGCEDSQNISISAAHHLTAGYPVIRLNLRGAGPAEGTSSGHYHAGRSEDLAAFLGGLPSDVTQDGLFLIGVSLGGNMLLKFLGEDWDAPQVLGAVSVSAPIDLKACQERIHAPRNRLYHRHLLNHMKDFAQRNGAANDDRVCIDIPGIRWFFDFDDQVVAPRNGFDGAVDYYAKCSANGFLHRIKAPTLMIHSVDDPWIPRTAYEQVSADLSETSAMVLTDSGGHVGFHASDSHWPWHDRCATRFFSSL